jgi:hypothetical protein
MTGRKRFRAVKKEEGEAAGEDGAGRAEER